MSELQVIQSALEGAARRRRSARALRGLWRGLLVGAILSLTLAAVYHLFPLPLWALIAIALIPFPCLLAGFIVGGWRKPSLPEVARWVDSRQHLQERLSTALEVSGTEATGAWRDLVLADAAGHAQGLDPRRLLPFSLPRAGRWALLVLILGATLGFVPEYRSKEYLRKQNDRENIKQAGRQLVALTKHSLDKRSPALEPTQKSMEAVKALGDEMTKHNLTRGEALKDIANVADQLKQELKELGKDPALKKMEQAARSATGSDSQTAAGIQKQIESLQKQIESPTATPDRLEKMKRDLEKLQDAAKGMANQSSPGSDVDRQKLSESLSALSRQAQDMGLDIPQLDGALEALAANQTDLFLKDLKASGAELEKLRDMAKTLQQLQQQKEKMGKDLAEQLKNGQAEAAQSTLDKMMNDLKASGLSQEQLQKMLNEVSKAVDPAGKYGEAGKHMQKAAEQMKAGDKTGAGKSLAAASKEIEKMMQQLGDAQQMADQLAALNQAAQCIANGQGWRPSNRPGSKPGGKPGSGVGTWSDESVDWKGEFTQGYDNTGIVRPDMDPRGSTDRGDGEGDDALRPTKVKGQFSPGGQMPSITLKGVSIKGQSKIAYEEAATAAQSDAQSALSQEKVPRAYQGAVKEYFDDLKK